MILYLEKSNAAHILLVNLMVNMGLFELELVLNVVRHHQSGESGSDCDHSDLSGLPERNILKSEPVARLGGFCLLDLRNRRIHLDFLDSHDGDIDVVSDWEVSVRKGS